MTKQVQTPTETVMDKPAPKTVSVARFCGAVGISTPAGYDLVHRGEVRHFRVGKKILIPAGEIDAFIERGCAAAAASIGDAAE